MNVSSNAQVVLLISERAGTVIPYSSCAFQVSTGPQKRVLDRYLGSLVIYRDGSVDRIESIDFIGFFGSNFWQRALSFSNGWIRHISIDLSQQSAIGFEQVRKLVSECISRHPEVLEQHFENRSMPDAVSASVNFTTDYEELFAALGVPRAEDCLDSLT